ncbi:WD40-repeat-containing domain protein [Microdochium trichocladiopsis]|uniref:WD40-repeat-containing domain protein n=1 Tax=Microdochium trichocladiopsis TaxID=1682393 RepID=A0A9P9BUI4_9PEZI|nr:WD40-repeat-containing domain protein [Microdochium trichocladiopsis]KAH7041021.1 WD40-repeat-containing domain protein [Microdochium trichocladiopsis]
MAKRKRNEQANGSKSGVTAPTKKSKASAAASLAPPPSRSPYTVQVVTGSYDRILHGFTVALDGDRAEFADTFLFNAHSSAIRCLALSPASKPEPGKAQKVMLASGSSDERINVYNISAHPPSATRQKEDDVLSRLAPRKILENPKNREVGTLLHHASTVTRLAFPSKSKLMSASEDSTIAVTRTRDMALLSSLKAPIPKPYGRPSGDTAALGATPSGVNDFAVHPTGKLMISLSKGEKCMRLWNLTTGKKGGVLNFGREMLQEVGEGRHSSGEGRAITWSHAGDEFCVSFDRNVLVFPLAPGEDGGIQPKCKVMADSRTKVHALAYLTPSGGEESSRDTDADAAGSNAEDSLLAVSTEDGRILFFSTADEDLVQSKAEADSRKGGSPLPSAKCIGQVGGKEMGVAGRIKDFTILRAPSGTDENKGDFVIAAGSSDGKVRIFCVAVSELVKARKSKDDDGSKQRQLGKLLGAYETQNRITCLEAFVMIPRPDGVEDSEDEFEDVSEDNDDDDEAAEE